MELDVRHIAEMLLNEMVRDADANYFRMEGVKLLFERLQKAAAELQDSNKQEVGEENVNNTVSDEQSVSENE